MNNIFFPTIILTYLEAFRQVFSKPNYNYFKSFIWASLLVKGRKCITNMHNASFFLEKHFSSFESFFSQNKWDFNKVIKASVELIIKQLKDRLKIHSGFLAVLDTTKKAKSGKGMLYSVDFNFIVKSILLNRQMILYMFEIYYLLMFQVHFSVNLFCSQKR